MSILKDLPSPIFNNVENECHHLKGGRLVFLSPSPAVCVPVTAVTEDGNIHVLISRRGSGTPNYKHSYNLVCGYLDHKEEVQEAAKRELWEEVGLHVDAIKEENIIYSIDQLPWAINSAKDTSNLSLRFGLHFSCKDKTELPELTNVNSEPNEAYDEKWISHEDALAMMAHDSELDPIENEMWAFNHHEIYREWFDLISKL